MTQSYINSSFFIKDSNITYTSHNEPDQSYEKISEEKDIYLIHTDEKSYKLHRRKLLKSLHLLRQHSNVLINNLDANMLERFHGTVDSTRILYHSKTLKDLILNDIQDIFSDVINIVPGTVGAFFTSCFYDNEVPLGCNPKCAIASTQCDGFECADTVMEFDGSTFKTIHNKNTPNVYVYIKNNTKKIPPYHIDLLKNAGIKSLVIVYNDNKVSNKIYLDTIHSNTTTISGVTIAIMVIMIIFVLMALLYMYHYGYIKI
jgi:hypothetical protein